MTAGGVLENFGGKRLRMRISSHSYHYEPSPFRIVAFVEALCLFLELGLPPLVRLVPVDPDLGKRKFETRCESKVADQLGMIYVDLKHFSTRTVVQFNMNHYTMP